MFKVKFAYRQTLSKLRAAQANLSQAVPQILETLGVGALSLIRLDFETKSRGGVGAGGIKWKALDPKTIKAKQRKGKRNRSARRTENVQIGIDRGLLRNSSTPGFTSTEGGNIFEQGDLSVTVGFGMEYAGYFDDERPLIPDPWPDEWLAELDEIAVDTTNAIIEGEL